MHATMFHTNPFNCVNNLRYSWNLYIPIQAKSAPYSNINLRKQLNQIINFYNNFIFGFNNSLIQFV
jgi:hypothetical protein